MIKIGIGNDHRGHELKLKLKKLLAKKYQIVDYGSVSTDSSDYPLYGIKVGEAVRDKKVDLGIVICGSGIGISIAANKVKGVRCAKVNTINEARLSKTDNDANVIAINGGMNYFKAKKIINTFISTKFDANERYIRRVNIIKDYEK